MAKEKKGTADLKKLEEAVNALMRCDEFIVATIEHGDADNPKDKVRTYAGWTVDENCMIMLEALLDEHREIIRIIQGDPRAQEEEDGEDVS